MPQPYTPWALRFGPDKFQNLLMVDENQACQKNCDKKNHNKPDKAPEKYRALNLSYISLFGEHGTNNHLSVVPSPAVEIKIALIFCGVTRLMFTPSGRSTFFTESLIRCVPATRFPSPTCTRTSLSFNTLIL